MLMPIDDPAHDDLAVELGKTILWERALLPPVVLGQCEASDDGAFRCSALGLLTKARGRLLDDGGVEHGGPESFTIFLCPRHGADLAHVVRRWPR